MGGLDTMKKMSDDELRTANFNDIFERKTEEGKEEKFYFVESREPTPFIIHNRSRMGVIYDVIRFPILFIFIGFTVGLGLSLDIIKAKKT